jgi:hypothetical protein
MNVGDLIELLQQHDPKTKIVMQVDHGFNDVRTLEEVTIAPLKDTFNAEYGEKLSADVDYAGPAETVLAISPDLF